MKLKQAIEIVSNAEGRSNEQIVDAARLIFDKDDDRSLDAVRVKAAQALMRLSAKRSLESGHRSETRH